MQAGLGSTQSTHPLSTLAAYYSLESASLVAGAGRGDGGEREKATVWRRGVSLVTYSLLSTLCHVGGCHCTVWSKYKYLDSSL